VGSAADEVQALTERLDEIADPAARETADELAGAIVALYGDALERILELGGEELRERLAADPDLGGLLLAHGLHPVDLETRVRTALNEVRPYLESHGGDIELLGIDEGVARLRLRGSCDGCAASAATLEGAVEQVLRDAAPDLAGMDVEGAVAKRERPAASSSEWVALDGAQDIPRGHLVQVTSGLVIANVAGTLLAYRNRCASCDGELASGLLLGGTLTCATCGAGFDLPRAGRSTNGAGLQLDPVPLLRHKGEVKVVLSGAIAPPRPRADAPHTEAGHCELCPTGIGSEHRHLLHLYERRIVCVCETCWSMRSGDSEYRPCGVRTLWLEDFALSDELWAQLQIPIGLAFVMRSSMTGTVVALYPSPAGATEAEIDMFAWAAMCDANPLLERLEADAEALVVNRLSEPAQHAIAPIDQCYRLVGLIKSRWEGISGGRAIESAVAEFFDELHERSLVGAP
jgi:Fe-S cluster biogenesis protein NfuA/nitrite reductase/ring-hydroxylating ferredoxin subunit